MDFFRQPSFLLWGLLGLAAAGLACLFSEKRRAALLAALGNTPTLKRLLPEMAERRRALKAWLFLAALALLFLSLAGPQWGVELAGGGEVTGAGHVVLAVDTSLSMLAPDIKPSRMENAKMMLKLLIEELGGYRVGIVAFSGQAYIQCPMTTDQDALKYFLSVMNVGMLPDPGTSLSSAVDAATAMMAKYPGRKALILLTDGEDHTGRLAEAAKLAADNGISIIAVGIGKPEGELVPAGAQSSEYKKDNEGRPVVSKLGEKALIDMASATGGAYIRYNDADTVAGEIAGQLKKLEKARWQSRTGPRYKNRYQFPLLLALLLLLVELLVPEKNLPLRSVCGLGAGKNGAERK